MNHFHPLTPRSIIAFSLTGLICLLLAACGSSAQLEAAETQEPSPPTAETVIGSGFDRHELLVNMADNVIMPLLKDFGEQAAALEDAAHQFRDDPTEADLEDVQQAWQQAALGWNRLVFFELGSFRKSNGDLVSFMELYNKIDKWPTNVDFIEKFIAEQEAIDEPLIDANGSTTKGLPAIEYLIFNPAGNAQVVSSFTDDPAGQKRMQYLVAAAENLNHKAEDLFNIWAAEGDNYAGNFINADADSGEQQQLLSLLVNQMTAGLEDIVKRKIGHPLGKTSQAGVRPELVEAELSGLSGQLLHSNFEGLATVFNGGQQLGFDDYLDYLGAEYEGQPLSKVINAQIETTQAALKAIDGPLHQAMAHQPDQVELVYNEARKLIVLIKADMANHLAVTMTFNDSDGD
ncbi:MAG: imelysin family protein [Anaerolineaceae bacterium]|nr:imelysin family protein [Anaerolineaceae bacterium]MCB9098280.1 imelysin family protein [Anaerolineales bacterium]